MKIRSYTELSKLKTFEERFNYLRLDESLGQETFGFDRYLNQNFYKSKEWKQVRDQVIIRDNGCDLGVDGYNILRGKVIVHHMNPILPKMLESEINYSLLLDPEYLISTTHNTHNAIHYGNEDTLIKMPDARTPNDTCLWKSSTYKESLYI